MPSKVSLLAQLLLLPLPWSLRRPLLNRLGGFAISPGARLGRSIILARTVEMAPGSRIGNLTFAKGLDRLVLEERAGIGSLNWITAFPKGDTRFFTHRPDRDPSLIVRRHAAITSRHLIDCTGGFTVGAFTTFGGWGSQVVSHSIDVKTSRQDAEPIAIGDYCFIGTRVVLLKGAVLPDRSVLAAGSVLGKAFAEPLGLFSGVPAERVRELSPEIAYFQRAVGYVH